MEENYLPIEIKQEILMGMTIEEILDRRKLSKEWKEAVDNLWCRLLKRDYNIKTNEDCYDKYKRKYDTIKTLSVPFKKIEDVTASYKIPSEDFYILLEFLGFRRMEPGSFFYDLDIERDFKVFMSNLNTHSLDPKIILGMPINKMAVKNAREGNIRHLFTKHEYGGYGEYGKFGEAVMMTINVFKDMLPKVLSMTLRLKDYVVQISYKDYIELYNTLNNNMFDTDFKNIFQGHPLGYKAIELIHILANKTNITKNDLKKLEKDYFY